MPVLWSARRPGQGIDLVWDLGQPPPRPLPEGAILLHLAGQTRGTPEVLAENRRSAQAISAAAQQGRARHLFIMSSVAVYRPQATAIAEAQPCDPVSAYGQAKLDAEAAVQAMPRRTVLRLGNLAGADALLTAARRGPVVLDPVPGQPGGPERSYIGPRALALVLETLIRRAALGQDLPQILNLAQAPALAMGDLLSALGAEWRFGPANAAVVPRVAVDVARLSALVPLAPASAAGLAADLISLQGLWP